MEIRIVIDAPRGGPLRWALFVGTPVAFVALTALWAHASGVPNTFSANQTLSASQMNANFAAVTALIYDAGAYSVGATQFVGATGAKTPGDMSGFTFGTGYTAAKQACQYSFPSRPTIHMCSGDEITRSLQMGIQVPISAWFSVPLDAVSGVNFTPSVADCGGWTTASNAVAGPSMQSQNGGLAPGSPGCGSSQPILCCD